MKKKRMMKEKIVPKILYYNLLKMIMENLWNWDLEWVMQLQTYILENYSANNAFVMADFINEESDLPDVANYDAWNCIIWNKTWMFYVSNGSSWLAIPNVKPFKPLTSDEEAAIAGETPICFWEILIGSNWLFVSNVGTWNTIVLPYSR